VYGKAKILLLSEVILDVDERFSLTSHFTTNTRIVTRDLKIFS